MGYVESAVSRLGDGDPVIPPRLAALPQSYARRLCCAFIARACGGRRLVSRIHSGVIPSTDERASLLVPECRTDSVRAYSKHHASLSAKSTLILGTHGITRRTSPRWGVDSDARSIASGCGLPLPLACYRRTANCSHVDGSNHAPITGYRQ